MQVRIYQSCLHIEVEKQVEMILNLYVAKLNKVNCMHISGRHYCIKTTQCYFEIAQNGTYDLYLRQKYQYGSKVDMIDNFREFREKLANEIQ